jgi:hypothetical protein
MGHYETSLEAYWAFFDTFNAQDAEAWAGVMSYPHVRVSPPPPGPREGATPRTASRVFETAEDYAAMAPRTFERIAATGWVRTEGIEPEVVHEADDRMHLAGGWTRFNAADEPILTNRVSYILTRLDERWGIQARFGIDSWSADADTSDQQRAALDLADRSIEVVNAGDREGFPALFNYPLTQVGVGSVTVSEGPDDVRFMFADDPRISADIRVVHAGTRGVTLAADLRGPGLALDELVLVTRTGERWGMQAVSVILP